MIVSTSNRNTNESVPVTLAHAGLSTTICRCGHEKDAHEHLRSGSDCGACDCEKYRRPPRRER